MQSQWDVYCVPSDLCSHQLGQAAKLMGIWAEIRMFSAVAH